MLSQQKKIGIVLKLSGFALLLSILLGIPLGWSKGTLIAIGVIGAALILCALPLMWKDGIRNMKARGPQGSHLHRMRQSGFFDLLMIFIVFALVLLALGAFGLVTYNATFAKHASLAAAGGAVPKTLEEARLLEGFVEYNFNQDLNMFAKNYGVFFLFGVAILVVSAICLLYMRFVTPIVRADDSLRIAHGVYRKVGQTALAVFFTLVMLFPLYWMIISSFKTSTELLAPVPTLWPKQFVWENYPNVLSRAPFIKYLVNTPITTCVIMALSGRNRSVIYRWDSVAAAMMAGSAIFTPWNTS